MKHVLACLGFSVCLAALSAGPAFSQNSSEEAAPEATAAAPVAYVYVQTNKGVNLYDAAANGKLTLVKGSPFKTTGSMAGSNRKYFFSLGTDLIHVYTVASNGVIGKQVDEINTQDFPISQGYTCGTTAGAVLDHTGQNLYVALEGNTSDPDDECSQFQGFAIAKTSGGLTFKGNQSLSGIPGANLPVVSGNDEFLYTIDPSPAGYNGMWKYERASDGSLQVLNFTVIDPTGPQPGQNYDENFKHLLMTPDPTNHVAISLLGNFSPNNFYLGSFTANTAGDLTSTNTYENMPSPVGMPVRLNMSPSGKLLAVGSQAYGSSKGGVQVFHFNGAAPITKYSAVLTSAPIDQVRWDSDNHLYALSYSTNQLFVYTITPTSIKAVSGSPYKVTGAYGSSGLIVVPK